MLEHKVQETGYGTSYLILEIWHQWRSNREPPTAHRIDSGRQLIHRIGGLRKRNSFPTLPAGAIPHHLQRLAADMENAGLRGSSEDTGRKGGLEVVESVTRKMFMMALSMWSLMIRYVGNSSSETSSIT